jgi:hypothetical protein
LRTTNAVYVVIAIFLTLAACGRSHTALPPHSAPETKLGCDDQVCLFWRNATRRVVFRTTIGDLIDVQGFEYKRLKDGSQKSSNSAFHHIAFCSKAMPAYLYNADGKIIVDWLAPNTSDGVFGYNSEDYPAYLAACHSAYGSDVQQIASGLGYQVDPQFVNQEQFKDIKSFGESLASTGLKRNADVQLIGTCQIKIEGHTYTDGRCLISIDMTGGLRSTEVTDVLNGYFAYINEDGDHKNSADGNWNGTEKTNHADDSLGTLVQRNGCWKNQKADICYQWLSAR